MSADPPDSSGPPRVSVLLPAFNAAATLPACLASIARQSERSWECVVVDDGSTDDTAMVVRDTARRDGRFRLLTIAHAGIAGALNAGLEACRAPLVARMDADDLMHRDRLARQAAALDATPELSAVGCHVRLWPRRTMTPRRREYERWLNALATPDDVARDAFVECPVAHPALMMRRAFAPGGYRESSWPEDYDLVLRALSAGHRIGVVPHRLLCWRDSPNRLSRTDPRYAIERFTACKAHHLAHGFLADVEEYVLWGYGRTGRMLRSALMTHGRRPSHIVEIKKERIGQRIHGAPVIPPDRLPDLPARPIVVSVAREGPRREIRTAMTSMGFVELSDYVCTA